MWDSFRVNRQVTIRHLVAAIAWLGLALAPMAAPAVTMNMGGDAAQHAAMDMPDMPCCPDQPAKPDCAKDCPFMAACTGMVFPPLIAAVSLPVAPEPATTAPTSDAKLCGFPQGPPARPPNA
jgi:hypothetical protein